MANKETQTEVARDESEREVSEGRGPQRSQKNKARPARIPMSAGNKLAVPASLKREGYQCYWSITGPDHPGKLGQMGAAWWEFVLDEEGHKVERPAGKGNTHVLMCIEQKYYDEDMAAQQKRNIDTTQIEAQRLGEEEYVPLGRKNVVERDIIQSFI